jgi:hypothetical protein
MRRIRTRTIVLTGAVIALLMAPLGVAATGDLIRLGKRGFSGSETKIVSSVPGTNNSTGGYATRQSNTSSSGGGAIYGCRSGAGGRTATPPNEPCIRANNLSTGHAFEFAARDGEKAGEIMVGAGGDAKRPFTTNATGVATGLNADRVDGAEAASLRSRWLLLNAQGQIVEQSGGFTVIEAYTNEERVYVNAGSTLEGHGLQATVAGLQSGDVSIARCQSIGVDCTPAAAKTPNAFVIANHGDGDDATPAAAERRHLYVTVTE